MRILNFGSLNLDHVYQVKEFIRPGETDAALRYDIFPGGKGLNQSIAAARAGGEVFHAGAVGDGGSMLERCLKGAKVDCSLLKHTSVSQGHAVIQVNRRGENCIIIYGGSNLEIDPAYVDEVLSGFSGDACLILQNEISHLGYILDKASEKGLKIFLNPSPMNETITALDLGKASWLLINEVEGELITGRTDEHEILQVLHERYPKTDIVLTLGSKGAVCLTGETLLHQDSYLVEAVDTTAAGDTFTGYFAAHLAGGGTVKDAMNYAAAASAISVTREGAASSIPVLSEVEEFLKCAGENRQ